MKHFKELILTKDTSFNESIEVETSITCKDNERYSLKVYGDINAGNINAWNIDAWNINALDINAGNINALDIDARNINAGDIDARNINALDINAEDINAGNIVCEKRIKKSKTNKTIARVFMQNKSSIERKEVMPR